MEEPHDKGSAGHPPGGGVEQAGAAVQPVLPPELGDDLREEPGLVAGRGGVLVRGHDIEPGTVHAVGPTYFAVLREIEARGGRIESVEIPKGGKPGWLIKWYMPHKKPAEQM